jgi:hypothetical protein
MIFEIRHQPSIDFTLGTVPFLESAASPPGQGKRHRAQLAAAKRTTPQSYYESRQARRARERRERMPQNG